MLPASRRSACCALYVCFLLTCTSRLGAQSLVPDSALAKVNAVPVENRDSAYFMTALPYYALHSNEGYNIALECFLQGLKLVRKYKHNQYLPEFYFLIGSVYDALEQNDGAIAYYSLHYNSLVARGDSVNILHKAAYDLATVFSRKKNLDSTLKYAHLMEHYAELADGKKLDKHGNDLITISNLLIANIMMKLESKEYFIEYFKKIPANARFSDSQIPYGLMYALAKTKYYSLRGSQTELLEPLLTELEVTKDSLVIYKHIYNLLIENKRYEEAAHYQVLIDKEKERNSNAVFNEIQYKLIKAEKEQKEWNNHLLQVEQKQLSQRNQLLIIISVILTLGLLATFYGYRRFRDQNRLLNKQNQQISEQKEQLELTMDKLRASNRDKDRILQVVAHDLRNPISGVMQLSDRIMEREEDAVNRKSLDIVIRTMQSSLLLINELLEFSDSTREAYVRQKDIADLNEIVTEVTTLLQFKADEKNQVLTVALSKEPLPVVLYKEKMLRVISNLITNAIKFSQAGTVVNVTTYVKNGKAIAEIRDAGIGIPLDIQPFIFDTFTPAKRNGTYGERSFGLGLSICKQIVEGNNGRIWCESHAGAGSVFFIELPMHNI